MFHELESGEKRNETGLFVQKKKMLKSSQTLCVEEVMQVLTATLLAFFQLFAHFF